MTEEELKKYVDEYFSKYMLIPFEKFIENWEETEQWADYYYKKQHKLQARINEAIDLLEEAREHIDLPWYDRQHLIEKTINTLKVGVDKE